jgi:hypothetical protein
VGGYAFDWGVLHNGYQCVASCFPDEEEHFYLLWNVLLSTIIAVTFLSFRAYTMSHPAVVADISLKLLRLMSSYDAGGDTLKSKNGNTSSAVFPFYNKPLMPLYTLYLGQVIRRGEFKPSSGKKHEE